MNLYKIHVHIEHFITGKISSKLRFGQFLTLCVRNGPSVSFGTNIL